MDNQPFAYTAPTGDGYPEYVNFTETEGGDLRITVRGPPMTGSRGYLEPGSGATMTLPKEQRAALLAALMP